jgi:hypothetical protein
MITQERLKKIFSYDPETGIFTRRFKTSNSSKLGVVTTQDSAGYIQFSVDAISKRAHQWAFLYMENYIPDQVDHDNRNKSDNRWCNLKPSNDKLNRKNMPKRKDNLSGVTGVYFDNYYQCWRAVIYDDTKRRSLGTFVLKSHAIAAREKELAKLNYHPNHGL